MARRTLVAITAGALLVGIAVVAGAVFRADDQPTPVRAAGERPQLMLLSSLPIALPETFTLDGEPSPVLGALERSYQVAPISTADGRSLSAARLLLMAQPQAQPAENLVELDNWLRGGGRLLLLADPALTWPSERPLGDLLRPPLAFADTGLLSHWGLRLDAPDELGPKSLEIDGAELRTSSPGRLVKTGGGCAVGPYALVARCRIGQGQVTVIADADFLNVPVIEGVDRQENLGLLLGELERLEQ